MSTGSEAPDADEAAHSHPDTAAGEPVDGHIVEDRPPRSRYSQSRIDVNSSQSRYVSELPSPDDLDRYAQHVPDVVERLLRGAEIEQRHRHEAEDRLIALEEKAMPRFYDGQRRGQVLGALVAVVYLTVMAYAIREGAELAGIGGAALGVAAVVWAIRRDPSGPVEPGDAVTKTEQA